MVLPILITTYPDIILISLQVSDVLLFNQFIIFIINYIKYFSFFYKPNIGDIFVVSTIRAKH